MKYIPQLLVLLFASVAIAEEPELQEDYELRGEWGSLSHDGNSFELGTGEGLRGVRESIHRE